MKNYIKQLLRSGLIYEDYNLSSRTLYGYHVTTESAVDKIKNNGFLVGSGRMEGRGVYSFYDLDRASGYSSKEMKTNFIIKFKITDISKILILDMDIAKEVLGNLYHIHNQLENYFKDKGGLEFTYNDSKSIVSWVDKNEYLSFLSKIELMDSRDSGPEFFTHHTSKLEDYINVINYGNYGLQYRINEPSIMKPIEYYELQPFTKKIIRNEKLYKTIT
jgi:hypothetical protein